MNWNEDTYNKFDLSDISNLEAKEKVAEKIVDKIKDGDVIGFGSGSTSYLATIAIANIVKEKGWNIFAVPTSKKIEDLCKKLEIPVMNLNESSLDWSFDGADEVNTKRWLIKGLGAAMFKEKLNIISSPITYILIDESKKVNKLGEKCKVPVECFPGAEKLVIKELISLGAYDITKREDRSTKEALITESGNIILDAKFDNIEENLEKQIKLIPGVIESGLFIGYNTMILE